MNTCPKCKKEYDDTWKVCLHCRGPLEHIKDDPKQPSTYIPSDGTKTCPYCAEKIQESAIICKHCKKSVPEKITDFDRKVLKSACAINKCGNGLIGLGLMFLILAFILKGCLGW
jgi:predicted amidophosphoribosyltransferase